MTPLELERLVTVASDVSIQRQQKWEATSMLSQWAAEENPQSVATTLLQTIPATQNEQVFFYALTTFQRSELLIKTTLEQRVELRQCLLRSWLTTNNDDGTNATVAIVLSPTSSSTYLRTKAGVVLASLIRIDFPHAWPAAFTDLMEQTSPDLYFRTLTALFDDMDQNVDLETSRRIKDLLRGFPVTSLNNAAAVATLPIISPSLTISARLLSQLLTYSEQSLSSQHATSISTLALNVLKRLIAWIDIELVLEDRVMTLIFRCVQSSASEVGVPAVECLQELAGRGMEKDKKLALLVDTDLLSKIYANVNLEVLDASPIEVVIEVAKLVAASGLELLPFVQSSQSLRTNEPHLSTLWSQLVDLFFRCFAYDDIDVSGAVLPLASETAKSDLVAYLPRTLTIMYRQMRYPADFQFDHEDDDEAEEEMYRSELRKLYQRLVRISPEMCLQFLCEALANLPVPISRSLASDLEASLRLVFHYCEGIRPPPGMKTVMKNETFRAVLVALHGSDIISHPHHEVLVLYYDLAVRYYPIFLDHPELLPKVLEGLSGQRGLQHTHSHVRSRSSYLILRLVKSVVKVMRPYVETAVSGIQDQDSLRPDDALYLFETVGLLLGRTGLAPQQQQQSLANVITPHVRSMEVMLQSPNRALVPDVVGERLARSIAAVAYVSKGFSRPEAGVQAVLMQAVPTTLSVLEALSGNDQVRGKSMILLQRMILCVGTEILPLAPRFLRALIEHCVVQDVQDVVQFLIQLCVKFKGQAVPAIDTSLLPFLRKCHSLVPTLDEGNVNGSDTPPHFRTEQLSIQKLSFAVLQHIVSYRATAVLVSPSNASSFESVLHTMKDGATLAEDPIVKKACLTFFRELSDQWLVEDPRHVATSVRDGFVHYLLQAFVPEMIKCILHPSFDHRDALQARNLAEFSQVLFILKSKSSPDEYNMFLRTLVSHRCPSTVLEGFRTAATVTETEFWLKEMIKMLKRT